VTGCADKQYDDDADDDDDDSRSVVTIWRSYTVCGPKRLAGKRAYTTISFVSSAWDIKPLTRSIKTLSAVIYRLLAARRKLSEINRCHEPPGTCLRRIFSVSTSIRYYAVVVSFFRTCVIRRVTKANSGRRCNVEIEC